MNFSLRECIVKHILANFAIIPSDFIFLDKSKSLQSKEFLLPKSISFGESNGSPINNKLWGCQATIDKQEIKILLADCTVDMAIPEVALLIHLKGQPMYGLYFVNQTQDTESLIAGSINGKEWLECNTYLQATFLAGMERLKEFGLPWQKLTEYTDLVSHMSFFIDFHSRLFGDIE